jgi:hypothetical protein
VMEEETPSSLVDKHVMDGNSNSNILTYS